jgi:hypothetical protein
MPDDRRGFEAAARLARFPPLTVAGRVMTPESWADVARRATRGEWPAILRRLAPWLLVATPPGRANLRRWLDAGHPRPSADALPLLVGDAGAVPLVAHVLARLPDAVRWHVIEHVGVSAVGFDCRAWTTAPIRTRPIEIRLSHFADVHVVAHEVAHAWHRAPVVSDPPGAVEWFAALTLARRDRGAGLVEHRDGELLADACAAAWGAA